MGGYDWSDPVFFFLFFSFSVFPLRGNSPLFPGKRVLFPPTLSILSLERAPRLHIPFLSPVLFLFLGILGKGRGAFSYFSSPNFPFFFFWTQRIVPPSYRFLPRPFFFDAFLVVFRTPCILSRKGQRDFFSLFLGPFATEAFSGVSFFFNRPPSSIFFFLCLVSEGSCPCASSLGILFSPWNGRFYKISNPPHFFFFLLFFQNGCPSSGLWKFFLLMFFLPFQRNLRLRFFL